MIPEVAVERLFGFRHAFDAPVTLWLTVAILTVMTASGAALFVLNRRNAEQFGEAWLRWKSWVWIAGCILIPILLGAAWTIAAVTLLSLGCYREFTRATGLFREKTISVIVVLGIFVLAFASLDHWERLFFATGPLTVGLITIATIPSDRPKGYIQRVALGVLGFSLFGFSLGYMSNLANDVNYRPILLLMIFAVSLNDVFAYCFGKALGRRKLLPATSPGKTMAGFLGALFSTSLVVAVLGHFVFAGSAVDHIGHLIFLGVLISALGQLGDLVISSIKRDVGVKDIGVVIPGHGGLLDRFDSLVLVPPAVFHYLSLVLGPLGGDQPVRIFSSMAQWTIGN